MKMRGIGVSAGAGIGTLYQYIPTPNVIDERSIEPQMCEAEKQKYLAIRQAAAAELDVLIQKLSPEQTAEIAIMTAHREMVLDDSMMESVFDLIEMESYNACRAMYTVCEKYRKRFLRSSDELMKARAADMKDICSRLVRNYYGKEECNLAGLPLGTILAADDLLPSDTASMDFGCICGIVTQAGGATSHSAIIARSHHIPCICGVADLLEHTKNGMECIIDGDQGELILQPDKEELSFYGNHIRQMKKKLELEAGFLNKQAVTKDGTTIEIGLNIGSISEKDLADCVHGDFVGLFRSEFLYMENDHFPTEEEQMKAYCAVLDKMDGKPAVLRTLDVGGDKTLPYFQLPKESNPFLGVRGIRLCFENQEMFKTQLKAALRAGQYGNLWVMIPMVESLEDIRCARAYVEQCKEELREAGVSVEKEIKFGVMIEVPALVMVADLVAAEVDFVSIGSNDLTQYLMAADRTNPKAQPYYQIYHPSVFRSIAMTVDAFVRAEKTVCICGELGGDVLAVPVLIGMGMRKLSMSASAVGAVKRIIAKSSLDEMKELAHRVLKCGTEADVKALLKEYAAAHEGCNNEENKFD